MLLQPGTVGAMPAREPAIPHTHLSDERVYKVRPYIPQNKGLSRELEGVYPRKAIFSPRRNGSLNGAYYGHDLMAGRAPGPENQRETRLAVRAYAG